MALRPPSSRALKTPRLKLARPRSVESIELDDQTAKNGVGLPPFLRWGAFLNQFHWHQGEHVTMVGPTGAGKTSLALQILPRRDYVIVLATKKRDISLYRPLEKQGYVTQTDLDLDWERFPRIIYKPPLDEPTRRALEEQAEDFSEALVEVFQVGNWCLYGDEIRYLTDNLKLKSEMDVLWLQGRSLGISIMVSTQRPVSIPLLAFDQATHLFIWKTTLRDDVLRVAEFGGDRSEEIRWTVPRLPEHELLYVNTRTGQLVRTNIRS